MDLAGFPVWILIQFVLDKQQKSITKRFSGALGNKIACHKKKTNLLLLRQTLSENRNHTVQQQRQRQQPKLDRADVEAYASLAVWIDIAYTRRMKFRRRFLCVCRRWKLALSYIASLLHTMLQPYQQ